VARKSSRQSAHVTSKSHISKLLLHHGCYKVYTLHVQGFEFLLTIAQFDWCNRYTRLVTFFPKHVS